MACCGSASKVLCCREPPKMESMFFTPGEHAYAHVCLVHGVGEPDGGLHVGRGGEFLRLRQGRGIAAGNPLDRALEAVVELERRQSGYGAENGAAQLRGVVAFVEFSEHFRYGFFRHDFLLWFLFRFVSSAVFARNTARHGNASGGIEGIGAASCPSALFLYDKPGRGNALTARYQTPQDPPYPTFTASPSTMTGTWRCPPECFSISSSADMSFFTSRY